MTETARELAPDGTAWPSGRVTAPVLRAAFVLLVAFSLLLPSGSILGVNVKMLLVATASLAFALDIIMNGKINTSWLAAVMVFVGLLGYGYFVAQVRGVNHGGAVLSQIVAMLSVFSVFMLLTGIVLSGALRGADALRHVVRIAVIYSCAKVFLELLLLLDVWSLDEVIAGVAFVFGVGFIRLDTGGLLRINFPADFVLPLVLMHLVGGWGSGASTGTVTRPRVWSAIVVTAAIVIAYSRYLWFATALLAFYWYAIRTLKPTVWHVAWLAGALMAVPVLWKPIEERFAGTAAEMSDAVRPQMLDVLSEVVNKSPVVGRGVGFYVETLVRIPEGPWYYEFQWLALWMQFGFVGLVVLLILCVPVVRGVPVNAAGFGILLAYLTWLASGLINGFLLTSSAGVVFFTYWIVVRNEISSDPRPRVLPAAIPPHT